MFMLLTYFLLPRSKKINTAIRFWSHQYFKNRINEKKLRKNKNDKDFEAPGFFVRIELSLGNCAHSLINEYINWLIRIEKLNKDICHSLLLFQSFICLKLKIKTVKFDFFLFLNDLRLFRLKNVTCEFWTLSSPDILINQSHLISKSAVKI